MSSNIRTGLSSDSSVRWAPVPIHMISSDLFTPYAKPRETQSNIGVYLQENVPTSGPPGQEFTEYCRVANLMLDPKYVKFVEHQQHLNTGHVGSASYPMSEEKNLMLKKTKGYNPLPVNEIGNQLFAANKFINQPNKPNREKVQKSLFPRSVVDNLDYIKNIYRNKMLEALEEERLAFESKKQKKRLDHGAEFKNDLKSKRGDSNYPPFWYNNKSIPLEKPEMPVGGINDYTTNTGSQVTEKKDLLKEFQLKDAEGYIPGEIYKNKIPKEPASDLFKSADCPSTWSPKDALFFEKFDPLNLTRESEESKIVNSDLNNLNSKREICGEINEEHKCSIKGMSSRTGGRKRLDFVFPGKRGHYSPWGNERQEELLKSGLPYFTAATRWMEENIDPIIQRKLGKSLRRKFLDWKLSNL